MIISTAQLKIDRDRQFDDWGETVTFREYVRSVDPQTQQVTETETETQIAAIVGHVDSQPTAKSSRHLTDTVSFLVKAEELPTSNPAVTSRVIHNGAEYDVLEFERSSQELVYTLRCRKTS